jgi:hypothetical protein
MATAKVLNNGLNKPEIVARPPGEGDIVGVEYGYADQGELARAVRQKKRAGC